MSFDEELLRRFYNARGYADFQVVSTVAELTPDGKEFYITFTLEEGPQYKFGEIKVETTLKDLRHRAAASHSPRPCKGDVYNADLVEATIQAFTDEVGRLGYAFVEIQPQLQRNAEKLTIDVTYQIHEGQRVYVERIDITGNLRTLDQVIRREFRLAEGDAFNIGAAAPLAAAPAQSRLLRERGRDHRAGQRARPRRDQDQGGRAVDRRAVLRCRLLDPGRRAGRHPAHRAQPPRPGQDLRANFTVSQRRQQIDLSFTEPYFLERDLAAGFDLFRSAHRLPAGVVLRRDAAPAAPCGSAIP